MFAYDENPSSPLQPRSNLPPQPIRVTQRGEERQLEDYLISGEPRLLFGEGNKVNEGEQDSDETSVRRGYANIHLGKGNEVARMRQKPMPKKNPIPKQKEPKPTAEEPRNPDSKPKPHATQPPSKQTVTKSTITKVEEKKFVRNKRKVPPKKIPTTTALTKTTSTHKKSANPPPATTTNDKYFQPITMKPITDDDENGFRILNPPTPPKRPTKAYDMRSLRNQLSQIEDEILRRNGEQNTLYRQNLMLWERIELYKSNIEENRLMAVEQMEALKEALKVDALEKKRMNSFKKIKEAAVLKKTVGPDLEAQQYKMTSALSLAKTLRTKLQEGMEETLSAKQAKLEEIEKIDGVAGTLKERRRTLARIANLDSVEEKVFGKWMNSSRGLKRSFYLLRLATSRSQEIDRICRRFENFTAHSWLRKTMGKWKLYYQRQVYHTNHIPFREKRKISKILQAWKEDTRRARLVTIRFKRNLLARILRRWKKCIANFLEKKHNALYAQATVDRLRKKRIFSALRRFWKMCTISTADYAAYTQITDKLFTKFLFRRWSRAVLGVRLANNWNNEGFKRCCARSRKKILKKRFTLMQRFVTMERIARQRLTRKTMDAWISLVEVGKEKFDYFYKADNYNHVRRLRTGMRNLRFFTKLQKKIKLIKNFRQRAIFKHWLLFCESNKAERIKNLLSVNHYFKTLTKKAFARLNYKERKLAEFLKCKRVMEKGRIMKSWRKFASLAKHKNRIGGIVGKLNGEKQKQFLFYVVLNWKKVTRRRILCRKSFDSVKRRTEREVVRVKLNIWRLVLMRTKRANNALVRINTNNVREKLGSETFKLNQVNELTDEVLTKIGKIEERVDDLVRQEKDFDLEGEEIDSTLEISEKETKKIGEVLKTRQVEECRLRKEYERLAKIDRERIREEERSARGLKLKRMRAKKVLDDLAAEEARLKEIIGGLKSKIEEYGGVRAGAGAGGKVEELEAEEVKGIRKEKALQQKLADLVALGNEKKERGAVAEDRIKSLDMLISKVKKETFDEESRHNDGFVRDRLISLGDLKLKAAETEERAHEAAILLKEKDDEIFFLKQELQSITEQREGQGEVISLVDGEEEVSRSRSRVGGGQASVVTPPPGAVAIMRETEKAFKENNMGLIKDDYYASLRSINFEKSEFLSNSTVMHVVVGDEEDDDTEVEGTGKKIEPDFTSTGTIHDIRDFNSIENEIDDLKNQILRKIGV